MTRLLDLESFTAHVEAATQDAGFAVEKCEGSVLYVILHGRQPLRCDLKRAYRAYKASPRRLDDIVRAHLEALRHVPSRTPPLTEEQAAKSLLPMLNQAQWLEQTGQQNVPPLVHRPFVAGLVITYVFDFPSSRAYVNVDMMAKITRQSEIPFEAIHEYALENLRRRTTSRIYKTHGLRSKTMIVCETHDGYAATRVLLPDLMARWAERIPGRMLIGIPNRDFLVAFSDRNPSRVAAIASQTRHDAARRDHPLCADLLVWQDGQIGEYRPRH